MSDSRETYRSARPPRSFFGRLVWWCLRLVFVGLLLALLVAGFGWWVIRRVPGDYPDAASPIPPPPLATPLGGGLDGFESPYLGHTGSWDGKGGGLGGRSKVPDLDREVAMGLRWTFMPVYWRALEPEGPIDLGQVVPPAWLALDSFVEAAHERRLNILMQAPVVGGNAGGPPVWAGRREEGKSAPANMEALAAFAGKLAARYRPGGTLSQLRGWKDGYGVRAWELDNEPESYFTSWKGQAGDYAEFVTLTAQRIRVADGKAVIVAPGLASGPDGLEWLAAALSGSTNNASPAYRVANRRHGIGPSIDVVSLHNYEGMDSAFGGGSRTIGTVFDGVRHVVEHWESLVPGSSYERKQDYWHTEGNFDFFGVLSQQRRAAWRFQFFTRAFAAGLRKVCVMDASEPEQVAVRTYASFLPRPWPMLAVSNEVRVTRGWLRAYRHPDGEAPDAGQVWVLWAQAGRGQATAEVPVRRAEVEMVGVDGRSTPVVANEEGRIRVELAGDEKMAPPVLIIDRTRQP